MDIRDSSTPTAMLDLLRLIDSGDALSPASRSLIKITLPDEYQDHQPARDIVERLMGRDPAKRFEFIQSRASAVEDGSIDA